jgi:hypothetical protein
MVPSAEDVIRQRAFMQPWILLLGGLMVLMCVPFFGSWVIEGMRDGDIFDFGYYSFQIAAGTMSLIAGSIAIGFASLIVRFTLPMPRGPLRCPSCSYDLVQLVQPICPECGLALTEHIVALSRLASATHKPRRRRTWMTPILRSICFFGIVWFSLVAAVGAFASLIALLETEPVAMFTCFSITISGVVGVLVSGVCVYALDASVRSPRTPPATPAEPT